MSAEDELGIHLERPLSDEPDAAEFAKFWDDSASEESNIQIIRWWLQNGDHCSSGI
jgi:hypothetical protein